MQVRRFVEVRAGDEESLGGEGAAGTAGGERIQGAGWWRRRHAREPLTTGGVGGEGWACAGKILMPRGRRRRVI